MQNSAKLWGKDLPTSQWRLVTMPLKPPGLWSEEGTWGLPQPYPGGAGLLGAVLARTLAGPTWDVADAIIPVC